MINDLKAEYGRNNYHLQPGEVFVTAEDMNVTTVLGSCVAVCLWDSRRGVGGMNHVMLPRFTSSQDPSTRFGNVATFVLLDLMKEHGCLKSDLTISVFGGANSMIRGNQQNEAMQVGKNNIEVTKNVLKKLGLSISVEDTGGSIGRKLNFDCATGEIRAEFLRKFDFVHELDR